jgi:hypothetical protein
MPAHIETARKSSGFFRAMIFMWGFVLACQGIWILATEYYRSPDFKFPTDSKTANAAARNRNTAALAASLGVIRGDLWASYSLTYLNLLWDSQSVEHQQNSGTLERARGAAIRALTLAPHDARVWLALSGVDPPERKWSALQMSYLTGANETDLIPLRLQLALRSNAIADKQLQQLVQHEIRTIVTRKPELKPAILAAYRDALPIGQQFLEETLQELDPVLYASLRKKE